MEILWDFNWICKKYSDFCCRLLWGKFEHWISIFQPYSALITLRSSNSEEEYSKKVRKMLIFRGSKLTREEKVHFLLQSAFKVNRNNVKMLKIFSGPKMHCQNIVDGRYFQINLNLFLCCIKFTFQFCNQVFFEPFLEQ